MSTIADLFVRLGMDTSGLTSGVDKAKSSLAQLEKSFKGVEQAGKTMSDLGKKISLGVTTPVLGASAALLSFGNQAQSAMQVKRAFDDVVASAGEMGDTVLAAMQKSSRGLIANTDLMKSFNLAASLVNEQFALQLPQAFEYLGKVSAATGTDMNYLLDSLVRGVGRLSPLILDNLGIQVSLTEAYEAYGREIGKSSEALSKSEQQTAVSIAVMQKLKENTASMSDEFGTAGQRIKTAMENAKDVIGSGLVGALDSASRKLDPVITKFGELFEEGGSLHPVIATLNDVLGKMVDAVGDVVDWLGRLDPTVVQTATDVALFAAAMGPILIVVGKLTTGIGKAIPMLSSMAMHLGIVQTASLGASLAMGGILAAIGLAATAFVHFNNKAKEQVAVMNDARMAAVNAGKSFEEYAQTIYDVDNAYRLENKNILTNNQYHKQLRKTLEELNEAGYVTEKVFTQLDVKAKQGNLTTRELEEAVYKALQTQREVEIAIDQTAERLIEESIALAQAGTQTEYLTEEMAKFIEESENLKSLSANFDSIISYAYEYDDIQKQINEKLARMAEIDINGDGIADIADAAGDAQAELDTLTGEVADLRGELDHLANQAVLNMLQAQIQIGGVTDAEMKLFMDTAVAMGEMTKEGADAAYQNWSDAVYLMNLLELEPKEGEVTLDDQQFILDILALNDLTLDEKIALIKAELEGEEEVKRKIDELAQSRTTTITTVFRQSGQPPSRYTPQLRAEGGPVGSNQLYMVGERGPELFVPSDNGVIVPNSKLVDILQEALGNKKGGSTVINNFNLNMPTSNSPTDVKTAFELMESWV